MANNEALFADVAAKIDHRIGKIGQRSVVISPIGQRRESVELSRGGIVVPDLATPSYNPNLAVIYHQVGAEGDQGLRSGDPRAGTVLDAGSQKYVLRPRRDGIWEAFDAFGEASSSSVGGVNVYHLDVARPIETSEEAVLMRGLILAFDLALVTEVQRAIQGQPSHLPQDRL